MGGGPHGRAGLSQSTWNQSLPTQRGSGTLPLPSPVLRAFDEAAQPPLSGRSGMGTRLTAGTPRLGFQLGIAWDPNSSTQHLGSYLTLHLFQTPVRKGPPRKSLTGSWKT